MSEAPGEPGLCAHDHQVSLFWSTRSDGSPPPHLTSGLLSWIQLLTDIRAVVTNPNAPLRRQRPSSAGLDPAECRTVLPTLEVWAQQLRLLEVSTRGAARRAAAPSPDVSDSVAVLRICRGRYRS